MKFIADEGVDRQIVDSLRSAGLDLAYAAETDAAIQDEALLRKAAAEARVLITADKDFGELVYRQGEASHGVLLLRLSGLSQEAKVRVVSKAISSRAHEMESAFSVLSPGQLRVRKTRDATS